MTHLKVKQLGVLAYADDIVLIGKYEM